jgi:hypothetical protein
LKAYFLNKNRKTVTSRRVQSLTSNFDQILIYKIPTIVDTEDGKEEKEILHSLERS